MHSVKDISSSVCACTVIGGKRVLRHVTESVRTRQNWNTPPDSQPARLFGQSTVAGPRLGESRGIEPPPDARPTCVAWSSPQGKSFNIGNKYGPLHIVCMGIIV